MLLLEKAKEILLNQINHLEYKPEKIESVPLWEAAGRILFFINRK